MSGKGLNEGDESRFERGHVVWVEWLDHKEARPFLILNTGSGVGRDVEYVGIPLSTLDQENSIRIQPEDWKAGGPDEPSFALLWRLQTIPHETIEQGLGALDDDIVSDISRSAQSILDSSE